MQKNHWLYWFAAMLILVNIGLSFYFEISKQSDVAINLGDKCLGNGTGNCFKVQNSSYGNLFGISVSSLGIIGFSVILIILLFDLRERDEKRELMLSASLTIAALLALWFIYVQLFVLQIICRYCMLVDSFTLVAFAIYFPRIIKEMRRRVRD